MLQTEVQISTPIALVRNPGAGPGLVFGPRDGAIDNAKKYISIWDTGATGTVISQKVIDECGLIPIGMTRVSHAQGESVTAVFLVSVILPDGVVIPSLRVTRGVLSTCDVLIGMDIINQGDFAITHNGGKTTFTFGLPSKRHLDFVKQKPDAHSEKIGRNDPCPCGSGQKYKKCCGKNA